MEDLLKKLRDGQEISHEEAKKIGDLDYAIKAPFKYMINQDSRIPFKQSVSHNSIYLTVSKNPLFVKVDKEKDESDKLINEYKILRELRKRRFPVPKPRGIYNVFKEEMGVFCPGIVMEFRPGIMFSELDSFSEDYSDAANKIKKELEKLRKIGYKSFYEGRESYFETFLGEKIQNILYDKNTKRITLLDFGHDKLYL